MQTHIGDVQRIIFSNGKLDPVKKFVVSFVLLYMVIQFVVVVQLTSTVARWRRAAGPRSTAPQRGRVVVRRQRSSSRLARAVAERSAFDYDWSRAGTTAHRQVVERGLQTVTK